MQFEKILQRKNLYCKKEFNNLYPVEKYHFPIKLYKFV